MAKYIVLHSLYSDGDGGRYYRGQEVTLTGDAEQRALDLGAVGKATTSEAKAAVAEREQLDLPRSDNPAASMLDAPGLRGDVLREQGEAPPEPGTPAAAAEPEPPQNP